MYLHRNTTVVLLLCSLVIAGCSESSPRKKSTPADTTKTESALSNTYANAKYDIRLQYPESWILVEEAGLKVGKYAINVFKRGTGAEQQLPLAVHAENLHSYVAIWPHGLGTELPASQYTSLNKLQNLPQFSFKVNKKESKVLTLKNGDPWAYFVIPKNTPENWSDYGFIYAQVQVKNGHRTCYDEQTGKKVTEKQCDYLAGDKVVRTGKINRRDTEKVQNILESISLEKVTEKVMAADFIEVKQPLPNTTITSPLTAKGKARGTWYFEGVFTVKLYDAAGNLIVQTSAKAQDSWMTESFVPFKATLTYDNAPDDERGQLVFVKANPSGREKLAASYSIPVVFP